MDERFDEIISRAAERYGVPFEWLKAIIGTESSFNPRAYRAEPSIRDASYGLMQLLERTARALGFEGTMDELYDPEVNIMLGAKLIGEELIPRCGATFESVYSAYNSGSCGKYLSSSEVARNVERAVVWLGQVEDDLKKNSRGSKKTRKFPQGSLFL